MAGYSKKPLVQKLGLKAGMRAHFFGPQYRPPAGVLETTPPWDFIHYFARDRSLLRKHLRSLKKYLTPAGMFWISWPKRSSGEETDLDEKIVRKLGLQAGLVDVKVCAVDEIWSGLKFVRRLKDR